MFDLFGCSIFSLDCSVSESVWLPESEPLPESLLPDWLLLLEELELEPEPDPDAEPDPEPDSSSELLSHVQKKNHKTHIYALVNSRTATHKLNQFGILSPFKTLFIAVPL